jgi:Ca2+-transporting ATPase
MKSNFHNLSGAESLTFLKSFRQGLSEKESLQRRKIYGPNALSELHKDPLWRKFIRQFKDLMIILLVISSIISLYLQDYRSSTILIIIVFINAIIGFIQEYKAEKILESLKMIIHPQAKVLRNNKTREINSSELVPGDIVYIEAGDSVPADLRVLEEMNLGTNDFALTGESNPTRKFSRTISGEIELGDRNNMVFMGTTVATGHGYGLVVATGMDTELGKIANLSAETASQDSPLQKELNNLAGKLTGGTLILTGILVLIAVRSHFTLHEAFVFAIGIAAAMVPQGLPAQVSVALSLASGRLSQNKAVIKKLSSVETLGATSIICTDKTGTLTKNEMTVERFWFNRKIYEVSGLGYQPDGEIYLKKNLQKIDSEPDLNLVFLTGYFASNAKISPPDAEHQTWYCIGDPTEGAMVTLAAKADLDFAELDEQHPELLEFSFDSVRKRMSSIRKFAGEKYVFVKGAPNSVLDQCSHILLDGKTRILTPQLRKLILKQDDLWAQKAMRNLAFAYKILPGNLAHPTMEEAESGLVFLGLVSMIDPPREDVRAALLTAHQAHIKVIIITGDYALTAKAIARKVGLAEPSKIRMYAGAELREMTDHQLSRVLESSHHLIFSRTSPEDKLRIVTLLRKNNQIIAVTGDGINDAPALKSADIGVAMGKTGTDVAKESSEIILLDDSFSTLVYAVKEGRIIFQNLRKTILACLTSNSGELFVVLISLAMSAVFDIPIAITAVQILAVDLIAEMFPLTALTWDPPHDGLMTEQPRDTRQHLLNRPNILDLIFSGFLMGGLAYLNYFILITASGWNYHLPHADSPFYWRATALTYVSIVFCQFANIFSRRAGDKASAISLYLFSNPRLLLAFGVSMFCILNIIYNPVISRYFAAGPLLASDWLMAAGAGLIYFLIRELQKKFRTARQAY